MSQETSQENKQVVTSVIYDDPEIDQVKISVLLKKDAPTKHSVTLHARAVALWLAQSNETWIKYCIENKMLTFD